MLNSIITKYIKMTFNKQGQQLIKQAKQQNGIGRWTILNCNKLIDQRIDRSNNDHCGPCGYEVLENKKK